MYNNNLVLRKSMGVFVTGLLLTLLPEVYAQNGDSLTIEMAIKQALEKHPTVSQAAQMITTAQAHTQSLQSTLLPSVNATVSYANIGPDKPLQFMNLGEFKLFPANNYDGHITVDYLAFDFGKRKMLIQTGKISEDQATDRLKSVKQVLANQVTQLFNSIILIQQGIPVKDEEIDALNRHLDIVKKKVETGSATEFDILKTEGQLANSRSQRLDLVNNLNKLQIALRQVLCLQPDSPLNLKAEPLTVQKGINADSLIAVAMQRRAEHKLAEHSKIAAQLQQESVQLENRPNFGVRASAGVKNGLMPDIEKPSFNWNAGAQISIPVYDGNKRREHLQETESTIKAAEAGITVVESQIKSEILQAKADVEAALSKIDLSETQVKLAEKSLNLARLQYEAGTIINDNVLDAETEYTRVKFVHLQDQQRYIISLYNLELASGEIPGITE